MHGQESADLPERLPLSTAAGPYYQAFQTRRPVVALQDEDLATILPMAPPYQDHAAFRSKRFIITPLVVEDRAIGVTSIDNKASRRPISPSSIEPFTLLCQQFATAWEEARLYAETCAREREATSSTRSPLYWRPPWIWTGSWTSSPQRRSSCSAAMPRRSCVM